jgi:hypothetical protein
MPVLKASRETRLYVNSPTGVQKRLSRLYVTDVSRVTHSGIKP